MPCLRCLNTAVEERKYCVYRCRRRRFAGGKATERLCVVPVDEAYSYLYHEIFLLNAALCDHQRERHKRVVGNALGAVGAIKDALRSMNQRKRVAAMRLLPSTKGWSLTMR